MHINLTLVCSGFKFKLSLNATAMALTAFSSELRIVIFLKLLL